MAPASEPLAGRIIGGRYRIESLLGSGGMGVLYSAEHLLTRRRVALKLLHPSRDDELEQVRARFLSEARSAAAVRHPHVVDVLDMGTDERGLPFLVMELLEGQALDRAVLSAGRLGPEETLAYLLPIIGALAVLHDAGIVHRDVKPSNIFLCRTPTSRAEPKLLDFGLARAVSDLRLTRSGVVIGTPLYMSPEHAAGAEVGPPADVWSLGVVLFECLSGVSPYNSNDGTVIATQIMAGNVRPLKEVCSDLPDPFAFAVERALRRDLEHRYRDMRDLARGLLAGAQASGIRVPNDPDPIGLPGFRNWAALSQPLETANAGEHPSRPSTNHATTRPVAQPEDRHDDWSGKLLGLVLSIVVTLAIGAVLWMFAKPAPKTLDTNDSRAGELSAPPVQQQVQRTPRVEALVTHESATAPPAAATPVVSRPTSTNTAPKRSQRRAHGTPSDSATVPSVQQPHETAPALDVETEWK